LEVEPHAMLALSSREAQFIEDAWTDERTNNEHMRRWNVRSVIVIPLVARSKELGVAFFNWHTDPARFDDLIRDAANKISALLALALAHTDALNVRKREMIALEEADERLKANESKYRTLFDGMTEGFALVEPVYGGPDAPVSLRFLEVNPAFERISGKVRSEVVGKTFHELFSRPSPHAIKALVRVAETGKPERFEDYDPVLKLWVETYAYSPEPLKAAYFFTDISSRRQAEEALKQANRRNEVILASIRDDFYVLDRNWIFVYANRQFASRLGKEPADVVGTCIWDLFAKHLGTEYEANYRAAMEKREIRRFELIGKYTNAVYSMAVFPSEEGITVLGTDITAQKRAEEATRAVALFPEENPFPVLRIDKDGKLLYANRAASDILEHFHAQVGQDAPASFGQAARKALGSKTLHTFDFTHALAVYSFAAVPIPDRAYVNLYGRDVTEQRHAEAALMHLTDELEARIEERTMQLQSANKELQAFSYSVSHDLRAPLRIVKSYASLLLQGDQGNLSEKQREQLGAIKTGAVQMEELLKAVLDFSLLGQKPLQMIRVNTRELVHDALGEQKQILGEEAAGRVTITLGDLPDVEADPILLRQVFANLLSNAFKFTRAVDHPSIKVAAESDKDGIIFSVSDNGVGFPKGKAGKLFNLFQRLHSRTQFEGNGIGLANVRRIVERHGGIVYCEGEEGKGASFYFTLPRAANHEISEKEGTTADS
ncbi:MAG TPA: ATP-binding protein, partial [Bacteroidota bacterium]